MKQPYPKKLLSLVALAAFFYSGGLLSYPVFMPVAIAQEDGTLVSEQYTGQNMFKCNGHDFKIPSYFGYASKLSSDNVFITAYEKQCTLESFKVFLGIGADCGGQDFCLQGSFSSTLSGNNSYPSDLLSKTLSLYAKKVELSRHIKGYFIPSECFAYCNEAQLAWYHRDRVFVIGSHHDNSQETVDELVRAANSYIDMEK